ncbi:hypothetical protein J3R82DRAFT_7958 [Butyriboletus roseoflavus]|nr:hypothetical protein J3R82DRAFT_7958 [Butyriboletus roseoflavus]
MDSAPKALVDIASVSRRVFDILVKHAGHKTVESFQLEKMVIASGTILETLNNALILGSGIVDDRLLDWLNSEEPKMCLDNLNQLEALLSPKLDPDRSNEALRYFWRHEGYFHFLLSTEIWNRESGTQQQVLGVPPNTLHMHEAVAKQDVPQVTQHKSGDPSSVAQEKKPREQGVDTEKLNSIVRQLGAWSCENTILLWQPDTCTWLPNTNVYKTWRNMESTFLWLHGKAGVGKSVLVASVIDSLKGSLQDGEVLAYFYCDFRNEQSTSTAEMMRSLLFQLLQQLQVGSHIADPGDLIDELAKEKGTTVSSSARNFTRYISCMAKHFIRQPFLVLDALDECKDIGELLGAPKELNKGGIRLFVTS